MRAAVLYEFNEPLVVEEVELDGPKEGEVAIRMAASGVCHSDLHVVQNIHPTLLPAILGHEGAGVVEEIGPGVTQRPAGRSRDAHLAPVLRPLPLVRDRSPEPLRERRLVRRDARGRHDALPRRRSPNPPLQHVVVRRALGRSGANGDPGRPVTAADRARAHGLRRHDRGRGCPQHRARAPGRLGRGRRLRRRRPERRPGRRDRGSADDRRSRRRRVEARDRAGSARRTPSTRAPETRSRQFTT